MSPMGPTNKRRKLFGRAFYESLGSPKMVLAPMVDQSEFVGGFFASLLIAMRLTDPKAWRLLTRSYMKPESSKDLLAYTPMLHSRLFRETASVRDRHFQPTRAGLGSRPTSTADVRPEDAYLDGNPTVDRPLFVQFCANSPDDLLEAAKYVEPYCDAVDLNLGCPQGIAKRGNYGAFLQEDWDLIYKLIKKLHVNLEVPVTAKVRILETKEKTLDYAKMVLSAGASIITVHGRQRDQKGHKTGLADWTVLRYLRDHLPSDTVIFANGNILCHDDIQRCLAQTRADGVMSAEGNLCDPTIFAEPPPVGEDSREYWRGRDDRGGYRMDGVFRRYMDIIYKHVLEKDPPKRPPLFVVSDPDTEDPAISLDVKNLEDTEEPPRKRRKADKKSQKSTSQNLMSMQPHLFHLLRSLVSKHTNIRDALAKCHAGDIPAFENVLRMTEAAVREGLLDYEKNPDSYEESHVLTEEEISNLASPEESSAATVKACKRPWWVCQPYVRPLPKEAFENGSLTMSKKEKRELEEQRVRDTVRVEDELTSAREKMDREDGVPTQEIPKEAMVCG